MTDLGNVVVVPEESLYLWSHRTCNCASASRCEPHSAPRRGGRQGEARALPALLAAVPAPSGFFSACHCVWKMVSYLKVWKPASLVLDSIPSATGSWSSCCSVKPLCCFGNTGGCAVSSLAHTVKAGDVGTFVHLDCLSHHCQNSERWHITSFQMYIFPSSDTRYFLINTTLCK